MISIKKINKDFFYIYSFCSLCPVAHACRKKKRKKSIVDTVGRFLICVEIMSESCQGLGVVACLCYTYYVMQFFYANLRIYSFEASLVDEDEGSNGSEKWPV